MDACLPVKFSFIFMKCFLKIGQNNRLASLIFEGLCPPSGKI